MKDLRIALLADGSSDRALLRIIESSLRSMEPDLAIGQPSFEKRDGGLEAAMRAVIRDHRPDILFVHRDAERASLERRRQEIPPVDHPLVRIVPVRMTEAWLLFDEDATRAAADHPGGTIPLELPALVRVESLPDPKTVLHDALTAAADLHGRRRRKKFDQRIGQRVLRVAEYIDDFSPLRRLGAFRAFEDECATALKELPRDEV